MSNFGESDPDAPRNTFEVNLERIKRLVEARFNETVAKVSKLNGVYVTERENSFSLPNDALDLESDKYRQLLWADVDQAKQRELIRRNLELEKRLIVNETINKHFEQVISNYEKDIIKIIEDALKAESDRVKFIKDINNNNIQLKNALAAEEQHSQDILNEKTSFEKKYINLQTEYQSIKDELTSKNDILLRLKQHDEELQKQNDIMNKKMKQDAYDFHLLNEKFEGISAQCEKMADELSAKKEQIDIEKRKVQAVKDEMENRIEKEKQLITEQLLKSHEELLLAERNSNNNFSRKMRNSFESQLKKAGEFVDELNKKLEVTKQSHKALQVNFEKRLLEAITVAKQDLERKYMKLAAVRPELNHLIPTIDDGSSEGENIPRKILLDWRSRTDSDSSAPSIYGRNNYQPPHKQRPLRSSSLANRRQL